MAVRVEDEQSRPAAADLVEDHVFGRGVGDQRIHAMREPMCAEVFVGVAQASLERQPDHRTSNGKMIRSSGELSCFLRDRTILTWGRLGPASGSSSRANASRLT